MSDEIFCTIENEQKAFDIIKLYYQKTKTLPECDQLKILHTLDNEIQASEIKTHLYLNRVPEDRQCEEKIKWIDLYATSFRSYLNTLKIIFLTLVANKTDFENLSFEEFCKTKDRVNKNKAFLSIIHG